MQARHTIHDGKQFAPQVRISMGKQQVPAEGEQRARSGIAIVRREIEIADEPGSSGHAIGAPHFAAGHARTTLFRPGVGHKVDECTRLGEPVGIAATDRVDVLEQHFGERGGARLVQLGRQLFRVLPHCEVHVVAIHKEIGRRKRTRWRVGIRQEGGGDAIRLPKLDSGARRVGRKDEVRAIRRQLARAIFGGVENTPNRLHKVSARRRSVRAPQLLIEIAGRQEIDLSAHLGEVARVGPKDSRFNVSQPDRARERAVRDIRFIVRGEKILCTEHILGAQCGEFARVDKTLLAKLRRHRLKRPLRRICKEQAWRFRIRERNQEALSVGRPARQVRVQLARGDVLEQRRASRSAVGSPQLIPVHPVIGGEIQHALDHGAERRIRTIRTNANVLDQLHGSGRRHTKQLLSGLESEPCKEDLAVQHHPSIGPVAQVDPRDALESGLVEVGNDF